MEVRFACNDDIESLKSIWKICFNDSDAYINSFFQFVFQAEKTVVTVCDEKVVGVVYMLPATFKKQSFMYGYAIGVLPEYRGRSYTQKMLDFIKTKSENDQFLFGLHPANESLFSFYKKIGLKEMYALKKVNASNFVGKTNCVIDDASEEEYYIHRETAFPVLVSWDKQMLSYILMQTKAYGGFAKKLFINGNARMLLGTCHNNCLSIQETTMTDDEIYASSAFLKAHFHADKLIFYLPATSGLDGEIETTILGFGNDQKDVYMNLFLD